MLRAAVGRAERLKSRRRHRGTFHVGRVPLHRLSLPAYDEVEVAAMFNKVLIGACLILCVAGCASSPSAPSAAKAAADAGSPPVGCVPHTATRIPPSARECGAFGRVWNEDDIKNTGATDVAHALRLLDPSVTVTGR
jgi:hypothetical protein